MASILLVSRDTVVCQLTEQTLTRYGHEVLAASSAEEALHAGVSVKIDAAILDEAALDVDVIDSLSEWMRGRDPVVPVLILSARHNASPLANAGDEILTRPLSAEALRDAINRAAKAVAASPLPDKVHAGVFEIDRQRLEVSSNGNSVTLTPIQFRLIDCLAEHHGGVVPTDELIHSVWGDRRPDATADLLRSHVYTLRERLRGVSKEDLIENVPYRGYRLAS